jgi:3-oxoadipate enol-lactonase
LLQVLRKSTDVICYDLRYQGRSDRGDRPLSVATHVDDLADLASELGVDSAILLGSSISTLFARDFALRSPDRVDALILVGPIFGTNGGYGRSFLHKSLINTLGAYGPAGLFDHYYPLFYSGQTLKRNRIPGYLGLKSAFLGANTKEQLRAHLNSTADSKDPENGLGTINCPILILSGEDDFINDRTSLRAWTRDYANLEVEFLEGSGHNPYLEVSEAFQASVGRFIGSLA